jgi:hypothetical protein
VSFGHNWIKTAVQNQIVLAHLRDIGPLEPDEARDRYGIWRLAARIYDLRQVGHLIHTTRVPNDWGNPYARYTLLKLAEKKEAAA